MIRLFKPLPLLEIIACLAFAQPAKQAPPRTATLQELDGGPMATKLKYVTVNEQSAIKRRLFVLNDATCPVQLVGLGLKVDRRTEASSDAFFLSGSAEIQDPISAVEIDVVVFDLWGDYQRNLPYLVVAEMPKGTEVPLTESWWNTSIPEVMQFMTSVSYVRRVRTPDGRIWKSDERAILEKITSVQLRLSTEELEPLPPANSTSRK